MTESRKKRRKELAQALLIQDNLYTVRECGIPQDQIEAIDIQINKVSEDIRLLLEQGNKLKFNK